MPRVISIHRYRLREGISKQNFINTVREAHARDLFKLPGLLGFRFLYGIKGEAQGQWTAIWVYASREAWEHLWGPLSEPKSKDEYPGCWRQWEDDLLAPLLDGDPDQISFTSYDEVYSTVP